MKRPEAGCPGFVVSPFTLAALLALATATAPARAQFFSSSGANSTAPVNLFPINPASPTLDFGVNTLFIGNSAPGSFSASAGALLSAGALSIANGGTGTGSVIVDGSGTRVDLGGTANRLEIGNWGVGSLVVSAGAVVDATVNAASCRLAGAACYSFIGNGAGSTGTLTITGAGSELRALRTFGIGQAAVFRPPLDGFTFGTPGGSTSGNVNVLAGGTLRTENARIGVGPENLSALGTEQAVGNVVVSGAGSRWIVGRNSIDGTAASVAVGVHANGQGNITVSDGGKLVIDGSGGAGPNDFMNLAIDGGKGSLTVTGVGSSVDIVGVNTALNVGRSGANAQGSFSVLAGATASSLYVSVGRDGASGTMLISGAGSRFSQTGVGTIIAGNNGGVAFAQIGRD
ncbi:MAG: hypothetical protein ABI809_03045, partial [Caldimonas sp.]